MAESLTKAQRFTRWLRGFLFGRIDCPACGGYRCGVIVGEWEKIMFECFVCKHYWELPY